MKAHHFHVAPKSSRRLATNAQQGVSRLVPLSQPQESLLSRAEEHFKAVDSEISTWMQTSRYETFFERGAQTSRVGIGVCQGWPLPPTSLDGL